MGQCQEKTSPVPDLPPPPATPASCVLWSEGRGTSSSPSTRNDSFIWCEDDSNPFTLPGEDHWSPGRLPVVVQKRQTTSTYCARTSFLQEQRARSSSVTLPVPSIILSNKRDSLMRERERGLRCPVSSLMASWKEIQSTGNENEKRGFNKRGSEKADTGLYSL